jgi:aminopeptidase N
VPDLDRPSPRWNEGLASFLEDLATEELEGRPVLMERNRALLGWLRTKVEERPELREVPLADYGRAEMTDFAYSVGAAMFAVLYELTGPEAFRGIVGGFYQRYQASGATTDDLVSYAGSVAPFSLEAFFVDWVQTTGWVERVRAYGTVEEIAASYRRD